MFFLISIQKFFALFGLHVRRVAHGASIDSALTEQIRFVGNEARMVFEVGAADGRDSVSYLEYFPDAVLHAFEPNPQNFSKLAERGKAESRLSTNNVAVSNLAGKMPFHMTALTDASSLLTPKKTDSAFDKYSEVENIVEVNVITLDEYCDKNGIEKIDLLKTDAQGSELNILKGSQRLLRDQKIKVLYLEVLFMEIYEGACLYHEVASLLANHGYQLHSLYNLVHNQNGKLAWGDAIFLPAGTTNIV